MRTRGLVMAGPVAALLLTSASTLHADNLYRPGGWSSMASDRIAEKVGDGLIVMISEDASASNSVANGSTRATQIGGTLSRTHSAPSAQLSLNSGFDGSGQSDRAGKMVAQLSVTVDEVLPNGDLRISGQQLLKINGSDTHILLKGRIRRTDISATNTIPSSRIADAVIDYNGNGFVSRSGKPSIIAELFSKLGLP